MHVMQSCCFANRSLLLFCCFAVRVGVAVVVALSPFEGMGRPVTHCFSPKIAAL